MKKSILKIKGAQELNKEEKLSVQGGTNNRRACGTHIDGSPCWQTKLAYPIGQSGPPWGPCVTSDGRSCFES